MSYLPRPDQQNSVMRGQTKHINNDCSIQSSHTPLLVANHDLMEISDSLFGVVKVVDPSGTQKRLGVEVDLPVRPDLVSLTLPPDQTPSSRSTRLGQVIRSCSLLRGAGRFVPDQVGLVRWDKGRRRGVRGFLLGLRLSFGMGLTMRIRSNPAADGVRSHDLDPDVRERQGPEAKEWYRHRASISAQTGSSQSRKAEMTGDLAAT